MYFLFLLLLHLFVFLSFLYKPWQSCCNSIFHFLLLISVVTFILLFFLRRVITSSSSHQHSSPSVSSHIFSHFFPFIFHPFHLLLFSTFLRSITFRILLFRLVTWGKLKDGFLIGILLSIHLFIFICLSILAATLRIGTDAKHVGWLNHFRDKVYFRIFS